MRWEEGCSVNKGAVGCEQKVGESGERMRQQPRVQWAGPTCTEAHTHTLEGKSWVVVGGMGLLWVSVGRRRDGWWSGGRVRRG